MLEWVLRTVEIENRVVVLECVVCSLSCACFLLLLFAAKSLSGIRILLLLLLLLELLVFFSIESYGLIL